MNGMAQSLLYLNEDSFMNGKFIGFKENNIALTPSFFSGDFGLISKDNIKNLKDFALKNNTTARLNLFANRDDRLQYMLICHPHKKDIKCKKWLNSASIYTIIEGTMQFVLYDNNFNIIKTAELNRENFAIRIPKNQYYKIEILEEPVVFIEFRNGPYKEENKIERVNV